MINNNRYQSQVYEVARKRNTIAVMETGTGKTIIAVMLITEIGQAIKSSGDKKLIIFLAPTVHLVHQVFLSIPFLVMWLIGCLKLSILVEIECVFFFFGICSNLGLLRNTQVLRWKSIMEPRGLIHGIRSIGKRNLKHMM